MVNEGDKHQAVRQGSDRLFALREGERLDDLQIKGMKIIQRAGAFRFGTDAVLLADFAAPKPNDRVVDFGAGTGVLPLLMCGHGEGARFDALEIQGDMAEMAARSVALNGLEGRIFVHHADLRDAPALLGHGRATLVVCNPPYSPAGTALVSASASHRVARHEGACTIAEIAQSAAKVLQNGGRMALIYPAARLFDLMAALRDARLEPKRVRTVHDMADRPPKLALLDAVKGAGSLLHWLPPLILREADGRPTAEWKRIYRVGEGERG